MPYWTERKESKKKEKKVKKKKVVLTDYILYLLCEDIVIMDVNLYDK